MTGIMRNRDRAATAQKPAEGLRGEILATGIFDRMIERQRPASVTSSMLTPGSSQSERGQSIPQGRAVRMLTDRPTTATKKLLGQ